MQIGVITAFAWERYGPLWVGLLRDVDAEVVVPAPDVVLRHAAALDPTEGLVPWLARASLRALSGVDAVLVPQLLPDDVEGHGSAQDPWLADLPALLPRVESAAPLLLRVPLETGPQVEAAAMAVLTRVQRDAGRVRRAWDRHRVAALRPWQPRPAAAHRSDQVQVALAGSPWWVHERIARVVARPGEQLVGQHRVAPAALREEGLRWRADLVDADAETLGAVRRFARRGDISGVRLLLDTGSSAQAWLARRARELAGDRLETVSLLDTVGAERLLRAVVDVGSDADA